MKDKCKDCGRCCLDTEMILSQKDINLILKSYPEDLRLEDFVLKNHENYHLRNINGHCVFFEITSKTCKIYPHRPHGCRFYPLIYDTDTKTCIFDEECPRINLFYQSNDEFEKTCKKIKMFVRENLNIKI